MSTPLNLDVQQAQKATASRAGDPAELYALALRLLDDNKITYAAQVLTVAEERHHRQDELWFKISRRLALCVPGLFDPLVLDRLYTDGYVTHLVDGGV